MLNICLVSISKDRKMKSQTLSLGLIEMK